MVIKNCQEKFFYIIAPFYSLKSYFTFEFAPQDLVVEMELPVRPCVGNRGPGQAGLEPFLTNVVYLILGGKYF